MKLFRKWLPSVLLIGGSAAFLLLMLRRLGPAGAGVPLMLEMQSAWQSAPGIRAVGVIDYGGKAEPTHFVYRESKGTDRRADLTAPGGSVTTIVVAPPHAWEWTAGKRPNPADPDKDLLFPLPDPDCGNSLYRWAQRWSGATTRLVDGIPCQEVVGTNPNTRLTFDLDPGSHLPRRVVIEQGSGAAKRHWTVAFSSIERAPQTTAGLFAPPTLPVTAPATAPATTRSDPPPAVPSGGH